MAEEGTVVSISVTWRGSQLNVEIPSNATLEDLGFKLQKLTNVRPDTLKLFIPCSGSKGSKLVHPFSEAHSKLRLNGYGNLEGKSMRMMGALTDEIEELSEVGKRLDLRIAGFTEEENRLRQRTLGGSPAVVKLPKGTYIFCDFRTLQIPGIELNPPASEALRRMHMLASDPGIVAIMNKHHWRVGVMTEMAPVGYVGVSPKCILGFNKNHGEEVSLRLRTDDLKGFRKYESIKKTLIHELAHMVYSEHDENFFALDKQLNQEAVSLDWTKSRSQTLAGHGKSYTYEYEEELHETQPKSYKLGGKSSNQLLDARVASIQAAYNRLLSASVATSMNGSTNNHIESEDFGNPHAFDTQSGVFTKMEHDGTLHGFYDKIKKQEPDPDDSHGNGILGSEMEMLLETPDGCPVISCEPDSDDLKESGYSLQYRKSHDTGDRKAQNLVSDVLQNAPKSPFSKLSSCEPDPDDSLPRVLVQPGTYSDSQTNVTIYIGDNHMRGAGKLNASGVENDTDEPDPDDLSDQHTSSSLATEIDQQVKANMNAHNEDYLGRLNGDPELRRIQDPVSAICTRLGKAIDMLKSETTPIEAASVLQTLLKIVRNVIEHPNDTKFRRLRKGNPVIQKLVANRKAPMEILSAVGFTEDVSYDQLGRAETFLVLKRNDLVLLWLAKSSLEVSVA